jgi:anti-sigma factor RsiW
MNCEQCQELIHDFVDGSISRSDESILNTHLNECLDCDSVRQDLAQIVDFCHKRRGEYEAPPNQQALWLRIRNVIEAEQRGVTMAPAERRPSFWGHLMGRSWELSLPQLAASVSAIVLLVSLTTVVGLRRWGTTVPSPVATASLEASDVNDRVWQRQQAIIYWNQRVELNKARWSSENREAFERSLRSIDQVVSNSLDELKRNPHDEISEQMLNESLNEKLELLKTFSDL